MQLSLINLPIHYNDYLYLLHKYDMLRKSQHARISGLQKDIKEAKAKIDFLEREICRNNLYTGKEELALHA